MTHRFWKFEGLCTLYTPDLRNSLGKPPAKLELEPFETFTSDALTIRGWIRRCSADAPVVILTHGIFADRRQMLRRANGLYDLDVKERRQNSSRYEAASSLSLRPAV